jgi:hypothetical protein
VFLLANRDDIVVSVGPFYCVVQTLLPFFDPSRIVFDNDLLRVSKKNRDRAGTRALFQQFNGERMSESVGVPTLDFSFCENWLDSMASP